MPQRVKPAPGVGPVVPACGFPCSDGELRVFAIFAVRAASVVESLPLEREREESSWDGD